MFGQHKTGYLAIGAVLALVYAAAVASSGSLLFFYIGFWPLAALLALWLGPFVLWFVVLAFRMKKAGRGAILRRLKFYCRINRSALLRSCALAFAVVLGAACFTEMKVRIPEIIGYYADPHLVLMDRKLLGSDAWQLTHAVIGPNGTWLIDRAYALWFVVLASFMTVSIATRDQAFQVQALLSFMVIWLVLGVAGAMGLASVGPCFYQEFYGKADFAPLMAQLRGQETPLLAVKSMDYLLEMLGKPALVNGISAMPSLHVAMAAWFVLVAHRRGWSSWVIGLAALYAVLIFVGSIHLGWHYAVDGLFSLIVVLLIWWLTKIFIGATQRQ